MSSLLGWRMGLVAGWSSDEGDEAVAGMVAKGWHERHGQACLRGFVGGATRRPRAEAERAMSAGVSWGGGGRVRRRRGLCAWQALDAWDEAHVALCCDCTGAAWVLSERCLGDESRGMLMTSLALASTALHRAGGCA